MSSNSAVSIFDKNVPDKSQWYLKITSSLTIDRLEHPGIVIYHIGVEDDAWAYYEAVNRFLSINIYDLEEDNPSDTPAEVIGYYCGDPKQKKTCDKAWEEAFLTDENDKEILTRDDLRLRLTRAFVRSSLTLTTGGYNYNQMSAVADKIEAILAEN